MRKLVILALWIVLATGLVACGSKNVIYKQGTYEGNAEGHIGPIKVKIVTDQYEIKEIVILSQQETPVIAEIVYKKIPPKVIKANSSEVQVVAGATYTSNGLIKAIKDGLNKAKIE
ncbi:MULTISPECIES: FMN-binding protein [Clostridium]|uniref:FMN-binding protein n=1 Tax=Clostridium tagluense TaxID=360422 RepID=A0A401UM97_9CLOT|nr:MULTISPECIES: FMN-binding protein [Clostridium]MBU3126207.1 FMN-binding protein [Clostridium tagluense]MBW9155888.1 FMN-binding protein [Clostridium tagluense]MBZ9624046.1 FMN-binding protein [Clostridium sp. FP2]MBZ9635429.1 FMN-binding protein [Clostridium sp. FP1]WLC63939.1 FMN-binding protein [Clostridium tagluense]